MNRLRAHPRAENSGQARLSAEQRSRLRAEIERLPELFGYSRSAWTGELLSGHLRSRYGLYLNGLILVSGVLDFATLDDGPGNDLPFILFLPNFTATAHFHKKLPADLQADLPKAMAEARQFAQNEYALGLHQGATLPADERTRIVTELSRLTGLTPQVIEDNHLRIDSDTFRKQLLHGEGLILGGYDGRITGRDDRPASPEPARGTNPPTENLCRHWRSLPAFHPFRRQSALPQSEVRASTMARRKPEGSRKRPPEAWNSPILYPNSARSSPATRTFWANIH